MVPAHGAALEEIQAQAIMVLYRFTAMAGPNGLMQDTKNCSMFFSSLD